jgi:hypothetical protein
LNVKMDCNGAVYLRMTMPEPPVPPASLAVDSNREPPPPPLPVFAVADVALITKSVPLATPPFPPPALPNPLSLVVALAAVTPPPPPPAYVTEEPEIDDAVPAPPLPP